MTAVLLVFAALVAAACSPSVGALGTPSSPQPTADASVPLASGDATPGIESPSAQTPTPAAPTTSGSPSGPSAPSATPTATPRVTPRATATPAPADTVIVRAYFALGSFTGNAGLAPVLREIPRTQAVATAAVRALLAGPNAAELGARPAMYTTIPAGTTLLGLSITTGVATVNLSSEFESGGGSASMLGRLAQVVYTLTQFPTVQSVVFELDGAPVTAFGGEGIVLDRPLGRADFRDQLPAIFVDRPAWGAAIGNPATVNGLANVFEAQFRVQILDARRHVLADRPVTASCGTGCWGTFSTSFGYGVTGAQWGTLRVFDPSATDGSPQHVTEYPVWLTPAG